MKYVAAAVGLVLWGPLVLAYATIVFLSVALIVMLIRAPWRL